MKPDAAKLLDDKLKEAIGAGVKATLKKSPVSRSSFLRAVRSSSAPDAQLVRMVVTLRKKLIDRRLWFRKLEPLLAEKHLKQLISGEMKRQERAAEDPRQMLLGFENLPRTMDVHKLSVKDFLTRAARYEKRANKNRLAAEEIARLARIIRDQPLELSVTEALARAAEAAKGAQA